MVKQDVEGKGVGQSIRTYLQDSETEAHWLTECVGEYIDKTLI